MIGEPIFVDWVACVGDFRQTQTNSFNVVGNLSPTLEIPDTVEVAIGSKVWRGDVWTDEDAYTVTELDYSTPGLVKLSLK